MKLKVICLLFFAMTTGLFAQNSKKPTDGEGIFAEMETSKGKIVLQLEYQKTPVTVANFISLAEGTNTFVDSRKGKPFYDGLKFHRVIKDFMIQGGDPLGNGSGNPGYKFKDEVNTGLKHNKGGILSMANSGPGTNGSQFFITHKETPWLDGKHTVFGHVVSGMDVVNAIVQDDMIGKVTIVRKGASAKAFNAVKVFTDYYGDKAGEEKKAAETEAENIRKQTLADTEAKKAYDQKYGPVKTAKIAYLNKIKTEGTATESGLVYKITKGNGARPSEGTTVYVHYAGYLEDGSLFDSSYESVNTEFGKFDQTRADNNGYQPFPFKYGSKGGLIAGFLEGLNTMSFGDKITLFIPSKLGYGERGAGNVIPPNSNIIFEVELLENLPTK